MQWLTLAHIKALKPFTALYRQFMNQLSLHFIRVYKYRDFNTPKHPQRWLSGHGAALRSTKSRDLIQHAAAKMRKTLVHHASRVRWKFPAGKNYTGVPDYGVARNLIVLLSFKTPEFNSV